MEIFMIDCTYRADQAHISLDCPQALSPPVVMTDWTAVGVHWAIYAAVGLVVLLLLRMIFRSGIFVVKQQSRAIIERFGRYHRTADPGLRLKFPIIDRIVATMPLRIFQLVIEADTKTKDNVFVIAHISVQYRVITEAASTAWYTLQNVQEQMKSFVLDNARATIPTMSLDEVFEHKDRISGAVKESLTEKMKGYGYEITDVLVPEIDPDAGVKAAMSDIQTQQRLAIAAKAKGEANKVITVKNAEAEAESKKLQGEGIANQRKAIIAGLKEAVENLKEATGTDSGDAMRMVVLTQYFDTIKEIGVSAGSKVIFLPNSPQGMTDISAQIRDAVLAADAAMIPSTAPTKVILTRGDDTR
jgi:regulator of protease activity HflC (stomatin/prohibitin superfamily)